MLKRIRKKSTVYFSKYLPLTFKLLWQQVAGMKKHTFLSIYVYMTWFRLSGESLDGTDTQKNFFHFKITQNVKVQSKQGLPEFDKNNLTFVCLTLSLDRILTDKLMHHGGRCHSKMVCEPKCVAVSNIQGNVRRVATSVRLSDETRKTCGRKTVLVRRFLRVCKSAAVTQLSSQPAFLSFQVHFDCVNHT